MSGSTVSLGGGTPVGTNSTGRTRPPQKTKNKTPDVGRQLCGCKTEETVVRTKHYCGAHCGCSGTKGSGQKVSKWQGFKNFCANAGRGLLKGLSFIGKGIGGLIGGTFKLAGGLLSGIGAGLSSMGNINVGAGIGMGMMGFPTMGFGGGMFNGLMGGFGCGFPTFGCHTFGGLFGGCGSRNISVNISRPPMPHFGGFKPHFGGGFKPHGGGFRHRFC